MSLVRLVQKCHSQGKILNPVSRRCVSRTGAIGKNIVLDPEMLSVKMLREFLAEKGIKGISKSSKEELIKLYKQEFHTQKSPVKKSEKTLSEEELKKKVEACKAKGKILNMKTLRCNKKPASPKHASPRPASPRPASPRHASPKHASPRHASPKHASPKHASPKHASSKHASPRPASPKHASSKHASPRPASPKRSAGFSELPIEIIENIVKYTRGIDLVNLYDTNKELRAIVRRELVNRIKISDMISIEKYHKLKRQWVDEIINSELARRKITSGYFSAVGKVPSKGKFALGDEAKVKYDDRFVKYNGKHRMKYVGQVGRIVGYQSRPGPTSERSFSKYLVEFPDKSIEKFHSTFLSKHPEEDVWPGHPLQDEPPLPALPANIGNLTVAQWLQLEDEW